ncbi:hypothetical protein [Paraburkholderia caballeronis]|uniref:Uncharacterized protein n=1 Tax=Paraburkholderia caballeronis TaxID=416943 RepID=A0A1H7EZJ9_9BURK|nr:hypothetical protein [Paraburkholderia caballeronis]PXW14564.1 hypothetical protein C7403_1282 [Paraburkholderia caballeronis]PXW93309.1 hypothetical protein C7407_1282 [Paraburkholderia caballeronis]RAJ87213.1 hypothetical protein C7409_1282 [Paraburkholderia caballeronis]TDV05004.1 hypothetical protein C7408_12941 [Paraburkholderia caballeronis]TDV08172.1 hypothetical protein C7406_13141 [Paraburkholderia caballeronis]
MKPSTVEMLRAYLLVASLAATFIDAVVIVALCVFDVPEHVFQSFPFRIGVLIAVAVTLVVARNVAGFAFRSAVESRHAVVSDAPCRTVSVSADCPRRVLVIFHVRLNRRRLEFAAT